MQMAMVLTTQKPTQRNRQGEVPEGLPGSSLERGMRERKRRELGRSYRFLIPQKRPAARQTDIAPQKGKPGNGSKPEPKQTREGYGSRGQVGEPDPKGREPKVWRKSDPLIVLRRRESRLQGEGADRET